MTSEISSMLGGHDIDLHILPPETRDAIEDCTIPLPVQPQDQSRVDEKYGYRNGYSDLDRAFGTDWGNEEL